MARHTGQYQNHLSPKARVFSLSKAHLPANLPAQAQSVGPRMHSRDAVVYSLVASALSP